MKGDLINEFVDKKSLRAMETLLTSEDISEVVKSSILLADFFGTGKTFEAIANPSTDSAKKLVTSFQNNLILLIQKTWVEKSDEGLKAQVLYQLDEFCKLISSQKYAESLSLFFEIVDSVVYLMFGSQAKAKDFGDYALRIDPEFGIFWWYMKSLPRDAKWTLEKNRIAILLGIYFLANY